MPFEKAELPNDSEGVDAENGVAELVFEVNKFGKAGAIEAKETDGAEVMVAETEPKEEEPNKFVALVVELRAEDEEPNEGVENAEEGNKEAETEGAPNRPRPELPTAGAEVEPKPKENDGAEAEDEVDEEDDTEGTPNRAGLELPEAGAEPEPNPAGNDGAGAGTEDELENPDPNEEVGNEEEPKPPNEEVEAGDDAKIGFELWGAKEKFGAEKD